MNADKRAILAMDACEELVLEYARGAANGGSLDWETIDIIHEIACKAVGPEKCRELEKQAETEYEESVS